MTVLLPVYNAEKYIKFSIESILNQSFKDFEFIIIDDGSTDTSLQLIQSFKDKRIKLYLNEKNLGLIKTLNKGIDLAKGKYIARMDADDIAHPERLAKQFDFLEKNPNYALVGTQANFVFGDKLSNSPFNMETDSHLLAALNLFNCPFIHPSIMIRTDILKEFYYKEDFTTAEDYELWTRILRKYPCANLNESLLYYRVHDNNISTVQNNKQLESVKRIYRSNLEYIKMPYTQTDLDTYLKISGSYHAIITLTDLKKMENWLVRMQKHLIKSGNYDVNIVKEVIGLVWYRVCLKNVRFFLLKGYFVYLKSDLTESISIKKNIYLFLHTIGNYPMIKPLYDFLKGYFLSALNIKN